MTAAPASSSGEGFSSGENGNERDTDSSQEVPPPNEEDTGKSRRDALGANQPKTQEIRLAKVTITRTGHGVTMDLIAGKLRLRLYIDSQWANLIQKIVEGEGELNQRVPFRMAPLEVTEDIDQLTPNTLEARRIPELSSENPLHGTPLWDAIFPSEEPQAEESRPARRENASEESPEDDTE